MQLVSQKQIQYISKQKMHVLFCGLNLFYRDTTSKILKE